MSPPAESEPIRAAGGLLERATDDGLCIAVVHRTRYAHSDGSRGDWSLPKGKLEPGETIEEAALREVAEETGCRGRPLGGRFEIEYLANGVLKVVTFLRMRCEEGGLERDTTEVDEVAWLPPEDAALRLTYPGERDVVRRAYAGAEG